MPRLFGCENKKMAACILIIFQDGAMINLIIKNVSPVNVPKRYYPRLIISPKTRYKNQGFRSYDKKWLFIRVTWKFLEKLHIAMLLSRRKHVNTVFKTHVMKWTWPCPYFQKGSCQYCTWLVRHYFWKLIDVLVKALRDHLPKTCLLSNWYLAQHSLRHRRKHYTVPIHFIQFRPNSWGSFHKRQKPQAPTPQAPIRNRQTRKVANAKGLNRNTNLA